MIQKTKRPVSILLVLLMIVGMFTVLPISAGAAEVDYYIVGTMNNWEISDAYKLDPNPANDAEYMFTDLKVSANAELKVKDSNGIYYPEQQNLTLSAAGTYDIYFRPDGQGGEGWHYGNIFAGNYREPVYVAKIGDTKYETLGAAFAAVQDGETITLLANSTGGGIKVLENKFPNGVTLDFAGYTYTIDSSLVGSPGYESQAFHLEKGNTFTFKNGTITSENAKMLVQNYSDLTLDGMTLTPNNPTYTNYYTLSNNNGNIVIKDTTINANPAGGFAFDVCRFSNYPSVNVTVKGNSVINGDVEISASKGDAKDGFSLTLESGTMTGDIVVDASAQALVGEDNKVTKKDTFTQEAPEGFKWVDNGDNTASLAPIPYVAKIGDTKYETLGAAFAAVQDGETITLLANSTGGGIKVLENKFPNGVTLDFAGYTYTIDSSLVGSPGYESQAFHLEKGNTFTFKNGTITSENAKMLVQNYSDLTLDGMTLTPNNPTYTNYYTLSNNNGNIVIKDTTINANPAGGFAFDVCRFSNYPSVNVTVKGNSVINGDVEISASKGDAKDGFSLTLESGAMTGNIVLDQTAKNVIAATPEKAVISKEATFDKAAPADYKWDANGVLVPVDYVAQIGSTKYETLEAAFAAAQDGDTITLLADCAGNGIKAPQGKFATGLTVDFAGHTYTVSGTPVGSTGTETIGFQLLKGNKITFKNGTITGDSRIPRTNTYLLRMIQNYSDLTLDNMTVSMVGRYYDQITVSTCNGETVIKDSKISAPDYTWANITDPATVRAAALTVGTFSSYPSIDVTVEGDSTINGDVNVTDDNNKKAFSLKLNGGELNGNINLDENAKAAIDDTASTANVTKADTFTQEAPEGYAWKDNGNGTASLAKIVDLFAGYGLTLHGDIGLIFYLDPAAMGIKADDVESVSVSFTCDKYTGTVTDFKKDGNYIKVAYYVPAAYMASPVHAYAVSINGISSDETDDYSVQQYAQRIIADPVACGIPAAKANAAKNLMKEMLNYGSKAQVVFASQMQNPISQYAPIADYTMPDVTADMIEHAIHGTATDMSTVHPEADAVFYTPSVIYLSKTTLRMYFEIPTGNGSKNPDAYDGSQSDWYYWVDVTNIPAAELDDQQDFEVNGVPFHYSVLDYAKTVVAGNTAQVSKDLASALYLYNQAANAYYA